MARIGAFGEILFEVSSFRVLTFDGYKRKTAHKYATHEVHNRVSILESVGMEPEEISLEILLHNGLGVNPAEELERLREMCRAGQPNYLIIGAEAINGTQFVITELSEDVKVWSAVGTINEAKVQVKFKEYAERGN